MVTIADEGRKQEIEREKQQQLKEQKEGRNEWKDSLASESESIVCPTAIVRTAVKANNTCDTAQGGPRRDQVIEGDHLRATEGICKGC